MLECWVGVRPRSQVARHLDGNSLHNELSNLKYGTVKENVEDAFMHTGNYAEGAKTVAQPLLMTMFAIYGNATLLAKR